MKTSVVLFSVWSKKCVIFTVKFMFLNRGYVWIVLLFVVLVLYLTIRKKEIESWLFSFQRLAFNEFE